MGSVRSWGSSGVFPTAALCWIAPHDVGRGPLQRLAFHTAEETSLLHTQTNRDVSWNSVKHLNHEWSGISVVDTTNSKRRKYRTKFSQNNGERILLGCYGSSKMLPGLRSKDKGAEVDVLLLQSSLNVCRFKHII